LGKRLNPKSNHPHSPLLLSRRPLTTTKDIFVSKEQIPTEIWPTAGICPRTKYRFLAHPSDQESTCLWYIRGRALEQDPPVSILCIPCILISFSLRWEASGCFVDLRLPGRLNDGWSTSSCYETASSASSRPPSI